MRRNTRWLSAIMAGVTASVLAALVPVSSKAECDYDTGRAIQIGSGGIENQDWIYYGDYNRKPVKWRVLDGDKTNVGNPGRMLLLSEYVLGKIQYAQGSDSDANKWGKSNALVWCGNFEKSAFESGEQDSVLLTSDIDLLNNDRLFFLNYTEASNSSYGFRGDYYKDDSRIAYYEDKSEAGNWWLRTSPSGLDGGATGMVSSDGSVGAFPPRQWGGARPAFNLNRDDICLISNSEAFEPGDTSYPAILQEVSVYSGTLNKGEWKLTLKDDGRSGFQASADNNVSALKGYTNWKVNISYSGARAGDREYVYALLCDDKDVVLYYNDISRHSESGTEPVWIPAGLEPGKYTLKIFSGQWNGYQQTGYASNFEDIPLVVQDISIPKMNKPDAVFEASGDRQGKLSNVTVGMKYSLDGGNVWKEVTGESIEIVNVTENMDIRVYQPGDGFNSADSDIQIIDVTQAKIPEGLEGIACTTEDQNDGKITGVNVSMEYIPAMSADVSGWIQAVGSEIEGLSAGTYYVRVKAEGTVLASPVQTVLVAEYKEHICAGTGEWNSDGICHWKFCTCGARVDEGVHIGGISVCMEKAECDICKEPYGEPGEHSLGEWIEGSQADCVSEGILGHYHCGLCGADFDKEKNILKSLTIPVDPTRHTGGTEIRGFEEANCMKEGYTGDVYCTVCKEELSKGTVISVTDNHVFGEWKVTTEATAVRTGMKEKICNVCGYVERAIVPMISEEKEVKKPEISKKEDSRVKKTVSPKTGDMSEAYLWITLLFLGSVMCAGTISWKNWRKK
ncbi:MAG: hypothetical protein HFG89_04875 [Dorea sp.]|jgi:hypothetical protein|nr:hypothetical protein [Dorea sp.]